MKSERQFLVDRIDENGLVCGVSKSIEDIPAGTTFTSVELQSGNDPSGSAGRVQVNLQLVEVHFYQRTIQTIPGGHSAGLVLTGYGVEALAKALANAKRGEHVLLMA